MSDNGSKRPLNESGLVFFLKVLIVAVFAYPLVHYILVNKRQETNNTTLNAPAEHVTNEDDAVLINETVKSEKKTVLITKQPACPLSYVHVILLDLCKDLIIQNQQCTPEDFHNLEKHKIPKNHARSNSTGEPRGTIVGCIAAGLLLTSLGAAFVELYKAKSQTPIKSKPPMNRKCSLADLTVLKHNRKELVRRESILEMPENGTTAKPLGRKVSRPPLRLD